MYRQADHILHRISEAQFSIFTRLQALAAGHTDDSISNRLRAGKWNADHREVYAIAGAARSWERSALGAAYWSSGLASHRTAARIMGLQGFEEETLIEVISWRPQAKLRDGILVHFTRKMPIEHIGSFGPFPITSVERTLFDLCSVVSIRRVSFAMDDALKRELTTPEMLEKCLVSLAKRGRKGTKVFRALVNRRLGQNVAPNSPLETRIQDAIWDSDLKKPELQYEIYGPLGNFICRPDFVYPQEKLIIEGQSYRWHSNFEAWQEDCRKLNDAVALGYRVMWVTDYQIKKQRSATLSDIRAALLSASV